MYLRSSRNRFRASGCRQTSQQHNARTSGPLVETQSGGQLKFHIASLYPLLYRLEERGWLQGKWVENHSRAAELIDELSQHLDERYEELSAGGVSEPAGRRAQR